MFSKILNLFNWDTTALCLLRFSISRGGGFRKKRKVYERSFCVSFRCGKPPKNLTYTLRVFGFRFMLSGPSGQGLGCGYINKDAAQQRLCLWSRGESNPGPNREPICFLHAYLIIGFRKVTGNEQPITSLVSVLLAQP